MGVRVVPQVEAVGVVGVEEALQTALEAAQIRVQPVAEAVLEGVEGALQTPEAAQIRVEVGVEGVEGAEGAT